MMRPLNAFALLALAATFAVACAPSSSSDPRANAREITELPEGTTFYLNDERGSPVATLDRQGNVVEERGYHAYGANRTGDSAARAHGYVGKELDETGLAHFGARPYDPERGAFLAPDPVTLFEPHRLTPDPRRAYAYAYSAGDPVNLKDDNGEWFDTVLDVASIGYDLYRLAVDNVFGKEDNLGENLASLGADALSAAVPFATGGGAAVRAAKHADKAADAAKATHAAKVAKGTEAARGTKPPNMSPERAGRSGAFREAKRQNGIPVSQQPTRMTPNADKRGNPQPGRSYEFDQGPGKDPIRIRDDAAGHDYGPGNPQNRGPHFNDPAGNHYDY